MVTKQIFIRHTAWLVVNPITDITSLPSLIARWRVGPQTQWSMRLKLIRSYIAGFSLMFFGFGRAHQIELAVFFYSSINLLKLLSNPSHYFFIGFFSWFISVIFHWWVRKPSCGSSNYMSCIPRHMLGWGMSTCNIGWRPPVIYSLDSKVISPT